MKRKLSMLALLSLSVIVVSGCNNVTPSTSNSEPGTSASDTVPSETVPAGPVYGADGWDEAGLNYQNPNPTLKDVATSGSAENFVAESYEERAKILGLLEEYAMNNNLTGLVIYDDGGYAKYSSRIQFPTNTLKDGEGNDLVVAGTTRYDYVTGYGFGVMSEGKLNGPLTKVDDGSAVENSYPDYYHTFEASDPKSLNYMNDKGEVVGNYNGYVANGYFSTKLSAAKNSYEWFPSLASDANKLADGSVRPIPLENGQVVADADRTHLGTQYRIYVRTGADAKYNIASTKDEIKPFAGREIALEDYLTPYKQLHMQANGLARATDSLSGASALKGMSDYYNATAAGYNEEAWNNVGVKTGTDSTGSYIDFEFVTPCTPFYAMYYLSSSLYAPIPEDFLTTIGGIANWGCFVDGGAGTYKYTPVDTALSTGPYVVELWNADTEFAFKKNTVLNPAINGGEHRYQIPGVHVNIMPSTTSDPLAAFEAWKAGKIDACGIPSDKISEEVNAKGTQQTRGSSTTKLNVNTCDEATWEALFGENGSITQTAKEDYWDLEPALSNDSFVKGLGLALNRKEYAEKRGVTPSVNYFSDAYLSNPEDGMSYNQTEAHRQALLSYYDDDESLLANYGYDRDYAIVYFQEAVEQLFAEGAYNEGDTITIEICWQAESQIQTSGADIEAYLEGAFNDAAVCGNKLTLDIQNTFVPVWSDVYYKKMMVGQFDIGFGGISGNTLNPLNFMEVLKSDNSSGFTLNWGTDTNSTDQLIEYNGKKFTYDALWQAADTGTVVDASGKNATLYDAVLVSNTLNEDGSRSVVINYAASNIEDVVTTTIADVELWWYEAPNENGYDYKSIEFVDDGKGTLTMTIDAETASTWVGSISFDVIIAVQTAGSDASTNYVSLSSVFAVAE